MSLRLVEIIIPSPRLDAVRRVLDEHEVFAQWDEQLGRERVLVRTLMATEKTEGVLDGLEEALGEDQDEHRVLVYSLEATLPRLSEKERAPHTEPSSGKHRRRQLPQRISREELYNDLEDYARLQPSKLVLVTLATVVAAIGLLNDETSLIIGAIVIAPLIGPCMALALGTTLGDWRLAWRSALTTGASLGLVFVLSLIFGALVEVDPSQKEMKSRYEGEAYRVLIALASGAAGALAFTTVASTAVIGVTVAVAVLPPMAIAGLLLGTGFGELGVTALLVALVNVFSVVLAGSLTFRLQRIQADTWWDEDRVRKARRIAAALSGTMLLVLVLISVVGLGWWPL